MSHRHRHSDFRGVLWVRNKNWLKPVTTQQSKGKQVELPFSLLNYLFKVQNKMLGSEADFEKYAEASDSVCRKLAAYFSHRLKPNLSIHPPQENEKDGFFFLLTSRSQRRQQLQFRDTFSIRIFFKHCFESIMRPSAADKTFGKTTLSGAMFSPPLRRPPARSAQSITGVFIRNMMCRVGRSSALWLWLHSNVMESPWPLSLDDFFFSFCLCCSTAFASVSYDCFR